MGDTTELRTRRRSSAPAIPTKLPLYPKKTLIPSSSTTDRQIDDRVVDDVTFHVLYDRRADAVMLLLFGALTYAAFCEPEPAFERLSATEQMQAQIFTGLKALCGYFLGLSVIVLPSGPFSRPHPLLWRLVLGLAFIYGLLMVFVLFQSRDTVLGLLRMIDPALGGGNSTTTATDIDREIDSSSVCGFTAANVWSRVDVFCLAHFLGWVGKAAAIRSTALCWIISITWELTEVVFTPVLPNFAECWWDQILFDIVICNGLGIMVGMKLVRYFEARVCVWEGVREIKTLRGKAERVLLQFTPESWSTMAWDPLTNKRRYASVCCIIVWAHLNDLHCFVLKATFLIPTDHYINTVRLLVLCFSAAAALRQAYVYITDPKCNRLGTHAIVVISITFIEFLVCIKHGRLSGIFSYDDVVRCCLTWVAIMLPSMVGALCLFRGHRRWLGFLQERRERESKRTA